MGAYRTQRTIFGTWPFQASHGRSDACSVRLTSFVLFHFFLAAVTLAMYPFVRAVRSLRRIASAQHDTRGNAVTDAHVGGAEARKDTTAHRLDARSSASCVHVAASSAQEGAPSSIKSALCTYYMACIIPQRYMDCEERWLYCVCGTVCHTSKG